HGEYRVPSADAGIVGLLEGVGFRMRGADGVNSEGYGLSVRIDTIENVLADFESSRRSLTRIQPELLSEQRQIRHPMRKFRRDVVVRRGSRLERRIGPYFRRKAGCSNDGLEVGATPRLLLHLPDLRRLERVPA